MSAHDLRPIMEDELPGKRLGWTAAIGVIVILAGVAISSAMVLVRPDSPPTQGRAPSAIGMVEQTLVEVQERGLDVARRQRAALGAYGWVDVDAGIVQLPIDQAEARVIASYAKTSANAGADGGTR